MWDGMSAITAVLALILTYTGSVFGLGIWLSGKFRAIEEMGHSRHLQNLERFRRIGNALHQVGFKNGNELEP